MTRTPLTFVARASLAQRPATLFATWIERLCGFLAGLTLAALLSVVLAAAATRYLAGSSITGA
ncbi:MAG: hypothetical protein H0T75_16815, partial [Rhizobiales bacterium]|nr:hypothetical protein [Hyphomicrobiales bacterium]